MKKIISFAAIAILLTACTKHKDDVEDTTPKATIQFASPTLNAVYHTGDSVLIQATAISTATIHGYDLILRKTEDTTQLYFQHFHDHNDTIQVNTKWKAAVSNISMLAEVVLYLDHEGHTGIKRTLFNVQ